MSRYLPNADLPASRRYGCSLPDTWLRCYAASGPSSSSSSTKATQTTQSTTGANSPVIGGNSSTDNHTTTTSGNNSGVINSYGRGNVTVTDSGAIQRMADLVQQFLTGGTALIVAEQAAQKDNNATITDLASGSLASNANLTTSLLAAQSSLAAQTQSGGQTTTDKTITWIVVAAIAGLAAILIFKK